MTTDRQLLSGNEAIALAALHAGVSLGTGYPGTPSTEILENFSAYGGRAQWAPNEKVALEVGIGASFAGAATLVTMKHVGVNVAADPLFTAAYTGVTGPLVLVCADDPGMASSQNEQDSRHYARAAGLPMLEPCDSQQAYDMMWLALELSQRWQIPVMLRMTTRICHSQTIVVPREPNRQGYACSYSRDIKTRVMIPAYARPAHRKLREKLADIQQWNETAEINHIHSDGCELGIIASGVSVAHVREAAPDAAILQIGMCHPLPFERVRAFADTVERCLVVEEGDPYLVDAFRAAGIAVEGKDEMYRFGELSVNRVKRILAGDTSPEPAPAKGRPPQLCVGCPHRAAFEVLRKLECIVTGDIGCYTLGVLPPFESIDTCVCMGASIGVGLGLRHVLPDEQAKRVVSVLGDSTFMHSGLTGLVEMVYNPPKTGHLVVILDNSTTAMTGLQEHPGTGRQLNHEPTNQVSFEQVAEAMGITTHVLDVWDNQDQFEALVQESLANQSLSLIIARRPCLLAAKKLKQMQLSDTGAGGES